MILKENVKKILIVKPRGIGDVVLSTIIIDSILNNFPNAILDFATEKPSNILLENDSRLNKIIIIKNKTVLQRIKFFFKIRKKKYDFVFDFYSTPTTAQLAFISGAKYRAGFPFRGRKYAYNILGPSRTDNIHAADLHLSFLKYIGLGVIQSNPQIFLAKTDLEFAKTFFNSVKINNKIVVTFSPSGGWNSKKCPPEIFAKFIDIIKNNFNVEILLVWGPGDEEDVDEIINLAKTKIIKAPNTTISEMAALLKFSTIVVANDSGPMHIASVLGTPTISIHGPTNPELQGPYGNKHETILLNDINCIVCNLLECPNNKICFKNISSELFLNTFQRLIKKNGLSIVKKN